MISTGRPSRPPLALMSSRHSSIAACNILPAGAPPPVSASDMPTLIGSAACAGAAMKSPATSAAPARSAIRASFVISSSLALFLPCVAIRIDQSAGLGFRRPHDRLCLAVAELIEIVGLRVLDLGPGHARLRPLSVLTEGEIAGHGLEACFVHVGGELVVVETLGFRHGLGQHLAGGIGERSPGEAKRVDAGGRGLGAVAPEEVGRARNFRSVARSEVLAGDQAVGGRTELNLYLRESACHNAH